jgi:hypothetical protein
VELLVNDVKMVEWARNEFMGKQERGRGRERRGGNT